MHMLGKVLNSFRVSTYGQNPALHYFVYTLYYLLQIVELGEGEVRCPYRRSPLLTHYTQPNMGFLTIYIYINRLNSSKYNELASQEYFIKWLPRNASKGFSHRICTVYKQYVSLVYLDHGDVVPSVPDGGRDRSSRSILHHPDNLRLLERRHPAANHGVALRGDLQGVQGHIYSTRVIYTLLMGNIY